MAARKPPPAYEADTDGVRIRVQPRFMHDESEPAKHKFVWAYTVELENGSERAWKLVSRHWEIIDSEGRRQIVDGEGVVGQQPLIEPGGTFKYTSGAPLATPSGMMTGHYDLEADDGALLSAQIPTFSLDSPYDKARPI
ncbi:MAG: Co2+/Mg2+ efflux protein ApaG [Pseudomonadota bacterium]